MSLLLGCKLLQRLRQRAVHCVIGLEYSIVLLIRYLLITRHKKQALAYMQRITKAVCTF